MTQRRLLTAFALVLAIGGVTWQFVKRKPAITEDCARSIQLGMTESEVNAILGGPAGDYTDGAVVTYARGGVGEDDSGFSKGTNWWGLQGVIQVQFSKEGLVKSACYYQANTVERVDFRGRLLAMLTFDYKRNRHGWVPAHW